MMTVGLRGVVSTLLREGAMAEEKKKNQHFVPRMLLRRFAEPNTRERAITVFDIDSRISRHRASISSQCSRSFFYGKDLALENSLMAIEGAANSAMSAMLSSSTPPKPGSPAWFDLIRFMVVQYGRTPAAVEEYTRQISAGMEAGRRFARNDADAHALDKIASKMTPTDPVRENLEITSSLGPLLFDLEDVLVVNDSEFEFVINDVGIVKHNQWTAGVSGIGVDGFASCGLLFLLPISPRHLLLKYDSSVYRVLTPDRQVVRIRDVGEVKSLNYIQAVFAERNLYFSGDSRSEELLMKLVANARRAPRHSMIRAECLTDATGVREIIQIYSERPKILLALDWFQIRRKFASIPIESRVQHFRPKAVAASELLRGRSEPEDAPLVPTMLRKVRR